jgi:hypothetical protein
MLIIMEIIEVNDFPDKYYLLKDNGDAMNKKTEDTDDIDYSSILETALKNNNFIVRKIDDSKKRVSITTSNDHNFTISYKNGVFIPKRTGSSKEIIINDIQEYKKLFKIAGISI